MPSHLQLLGPVSLRSDGAAARAVRRKSIALLAYLIAEERAFSRDHLADLFWPDLSLERARRNLSWTLSNLTAHLPPCLHITAQSISFTPHPHLQVDSRQAAAWLHAPDAAVRQQALDLFRGPFMDGCDFADLPAWETWHLAQQELWHRRQQRLFAQVVDDLGIAKRYSQAVTYARRWVNLSPWVEEAHRALMTCLAADGRPDLALEQYMECKRALREELDVEPAPETEALYREIQALLPGVAAPSLVAATRRTAALPVFLTPLIGRRVEQELLVRRLADADYRLLSLVGPGGSGKTRLAVATADRLHSRFGDGVVFVPFADVPPLTADAHADERLYGVLADALGLPQAAGKRREQVTRHLLAQHLLLVLDNFEHLVGEASFVLDLLTAAPNVSVLLTSRQPLGVTAEFVVPLAGLGVPDDDDWGAAAQTESVQLFVERMERTFFGAPAAAGVHREIVNLCRFVEGSPLAIELLAPLVAQDPSVQWTALLSRNFEILATTHVDVPARQRSLRTVFEHTWGLLLADEKRLLAACAVFKAPFATDAAAALPGEGTQPLQVRRLLMALVQRSLLATDGSRFSLHPLLQQFAAEKLAADPSWQAAVLRSHAHHFMARLAQAEDQLYTPAEAETIRALAAVREDIFGAWSWCVGQGEIDLLAANVHTLCVLCDLRGWWREGETLLAAAADAAMAHAAPVLSLARLQGRRAVLLFRQSRYADAETLAGDVLSALTALNVVEPSGFDEVAGEAADVLVEIAFAEKTLGNIAYLRGDIHAALPIYQRSLDHARRLERPIETAQALSNLGMTLRVLGGEDRLVEAERMLHESLTLRRSAGDLVGASVTLANLAGLAAQRHDWDEAQRHFLEVLDIRRRMDDRAGVVRALDGLANSAYNLGDYDASCAWADEGETLTRELNDPEARARHLVLKGRALCALGYYGAAQPCLDEALTLTAHLGVPMHMLFSLYALVQGILDAPAPRPVDDAVLWPKLVQLAAHVAHNPSTLPSTAQRARTQLTRLPASAPDTEPYVEVGKNCTLDEAMQVGHQVVAWLKGSEQASERARDTGKIED